jgi:hypothetical protein
MASEADNLEKERELFDQIKRRYDLELQRASDFDSKAGNLIGYTTIITGLLLGLGTFDILDKTTKLEYFYIFFIGIGLLVLSLIASLCVVKLKKFNVEPRAKDLEDYIADIDDPIFTTRTYVRRTLTTMHEAISPLVFINKDKAFRLKLSWYLLVSGIAVLLFYIGLYVYDRNNTDSESNIYLTPTVKALYEMFPTVDREFINSKFGNLTAEDDFTDLTLLPSSLPNTTGPWIDIRHQWLHDNLTVDIVMDSRDNVSETLAREAIQKWSTLLKSASDNSTAWNFNITYFNDDNITLAQDKADIVLTLRDEPDPSLCINRYGYSMPFDQDPHPQYILAYTSCEDVPISENQISTTVMHELGHALGLGHTHNHDRDLMCSFEKGIRTCSALADPKTEPSDFDIKSILYIYGTDGFDSFNRVLINKPYYVTN